MSEQQLPLYHLKQWGVGNVMGEPMLTVETTEGLHIAVVMPASAASAIAAALAGEAEKDSRPTRN
jgi:hypothetical protein